MFVCRSRSHVERNQQRSVKDCMHCHVVLIPESRSMQLLVLMESGIALLTARNPYVHRTVVSWPPSHIKAKQWTFMVSLEMLFS